MDLTWIREKVKGITKSVPKAPKSNTNLMMFDLLYQLSYMSVIAAAGIPRNKIFEKSARLPGASSAYFNRIELTQKRLQYDYGRACKLVGETARDETIKGLLLRFSTALTTGEPEAEFLAREAEAQIEAYNNDYFQKLEALKMWSDAYISLILSAVLVIIISIISTMIYKIDMAFIAGMVVIAVGSTAIGVWIIYLVSPREIVVMDQASSAEQKLAKKLMTLLMPVAGVIALVLLVLKVDFGYIMMVLSAFFIPVGIIIYRDDGYIMKRDAEIGVFLRSLGGVCGAVGATIKDALNRLDLDSIVSLRENVKHLHTRLISGIKGSLCWERFILESGSELVRRSVGMFYDAIELGGDAQRAGYRASIFAVRISLLRARRKTVSSPFRWLCFAMHASVVGLLVFITEVITIFGEMVSAAEASMPKISGAPTAGTFTTFNYSGLGVMHNLVVPLVLVFTVANALAPTIADGGNRYKMFLNLGITTAIASAGLVILPLIAHSLFSSIKI